MPNLPDNKDSEAHATNNPDHLSTPTEPLSKSGDAVEVVKDKNALNLDGLKP